MLAYLAGPLELTKVIPYSCPFALGTSVTFYKQDVSHLGGHVVHNSMQFYSPFACVHSDIRHATFHEVHRQQYLLARMWVG